MGTEWNGDYVSPYAEHGKKSTRRQVNNLRHATNSELLCEAFLHAFTGQPLPCDEDLRKDHPDSVPAEARAIMEALGKEIEDFDAE